MTRRVFLGGGGEWTMITSKNCQFKFCKERQPVKPVKIYRILPDVTPIPYGHMDRFIHRCMCQMKWLPNTELHIFILKKKTRMRWRTWKGHSIFMHIHSFVKKIVADYLSPAGREIALIRQGLKDPEGLLPSTWARDMFSTHRMLMIIFTVQCKVFNWYFDTWEIYTVFCYLCPFCGLIVEILSDQCFFFI